MRKRSEDFTNVSILQLKVTLRDVHPSVWRRIHVRNDATLGSLHDCLQVVFDWADSHLHSFRTRAGAVYGTAVLADVIPSTNERRVRLRDVLDLPGEWLFYEYDPGDGWAHEVRFERAVPFVFDQAYPCVVDGRRACPPDDVGGASGYERFRAAISDPLHPEHDEMLKWYGRPFDATAFDVATVNQALHGSSALAPEPLTTRSTRRTPASRGLRGKPRATGRAR